MRCGLLVRAVLVKENQRAALGCPSMLYIDEEWSALLYHT